MPVDYSKKSYSEIAALLKAQGDRIGGEFNQTEFRTKVGQKGGASNAIHKSSPGGGDLGGGYCAGVCADWARRVLLSGASKTNDATKSEAQKYLSYGYTKGVVGPGKGSQDRAYETVGRMAKAWDKSIGMVYEGENKVDPGLWAANAANIDQSFSQRRTANQRPLSSKPFSSLQLVDSKLATYQSAGQWMATALSNALQPGCVTKFGFKRVGQGGHAVAVWQRKSTVNDPDSFYFFDPNYGVFSYKKEGLQMALQILFWMDSEDTPKYLTCASADAQKMDYMIFGPAKMVGGNQNPQPAIAVPQIQTVVVVPQTIVITPQHQTPSGHGQIPMSHMTPPPVNSYSSPALGLPSPGIVSTKAATTSAQTTGGGGATLKAKLQAAMVDGKHLDKRAGVGTTDGLGYVLLDQELCKQVIATKRFPIVAGLKGESPMGDWLMKGSLKQIIDKLD